MDGLKDGVVSDPHACRFDPAAIQCRPGKAAGCLSAQKVAAVRRIYSGPVDSKGAALDNAAPLRGSELAWIGAFLTEDGSPSPLLVSMTAMFRNLASPRRGDAWTLRQLDWDTVAQDVSPAEAFTSAANPDLSHFKARGGKLIAYHGLTDPFVLPDNFSDYYRTVERTMGGRGQTVDFFRLFQPAGMDHCAGGDGAGVIDYIAALEAWVELGRAPQVLIAAHLKAPNADAADHLPVAPGEIAFSRPVFPYPMVTRYAGRGDPTLAASFVAAPSKAR